MKHETNDQFLDRLESQRLKAQGYDFRLLDHETEQDKAFIKDCQIALSKAVSKLWCLKTCV